jgi:hypothetical protein
MTASSLTPAEIRQRAQDWYDRQMAISAKALGDKWAEHRDWVSDYLQEEIRQRLHALGWRAAE